MPRKNAARKPSAKATRSKTQGLKIGDSYVSLFLGALVVVIIALIGFSFLKLERDSGGTKQTSSTSTVAPGEELANESSNLPEKYTVKTGDDLWSISEKIYGSGYNWVDIAKANKLSDPETIHAGTSLTIPNVKPIMPEVQITPQTITTQAEGAILTDTYTVATGDNLWDIAVRAYGDGYKWTDLAKENKLENPSLIFPGDIFRIPR
ncbi:MAG: LysM peptidoglycan-binding domain-containing protein [Candidatus Levyibacteriota bacterium]